MSLLLAYAGTHTAAAAMLFAGATRAHLIDTPPFAAALDRRARNRRAHDRRAQGRRHINERRHAERREARTTAGLLGIG